MFSRSLFTWIAALCIVALAVFILAASVPEVAVQNSTATTSQSASIAVVAPATTSAPGVSSTPKTTPKAAKPKAAKTPANTTSNATTSQITRIQNPYPFAPKSMEEVNASTRAALVNILCAPRSGSLKPISGSGVIVSPSGVILTNAHVAQYVLLSQDPRFDLSCTIRVGAPAQPALIADVLFMPSVWVAEHARDITIDKPTGTGEHDYALLRVVSTISGTPLPGPLPYLEPDSREAIGFLDDQVLAAGYPAEFVGGIAAQYGLYPVSSISTIRELLTFSSGSVDIFSIGGVVEAQGGSSGGPVVNVWGRLIGMITTTSEGATTAERDLRALTLSYINTDIAAQSGKNLQTILTGNITEQANDFRQNVAPVLIAKYVAVLSH